MPRFDQPQTWNPDSYERDAGFAAAFAIYRRKGRFALPRVDVNALDTRSSFTLKTSGLY